MLVICARCCRATVVDFMLFYSQTQPYQLNHQFRFIISFSFFTHKNNKTITKEPRERGPIIQCTVGRPPLSCDAYSIQVRLTLLLVKGTLLGHGTLSELL